MNRRSCLLWLYCDRSSNNLSRTLEHARSSGPAVLPTAMQASVQASRWSDPPFSSNDLALCGGVAQPIGSVRRVRRIHGTDPLLRWRVSLNRSTPSAGCSSQKTIPRPSRESCIVARTVAYGCTQTSFRGIWIQLLMLQNAKF